MILSTQSAFIMDNSSVDYCCHEQTAAELHVVLFRITSVSQVSHEYLPLLTLSYLLIRFFRHLSPVVFLKKIAEFH